MVMSKKRRMSRLMGLGLLALSVVGVSSGYAAAPAGAVLEEVIVTAQRREQALTDVPLSITALTSDFLDDVLISETRNIQFVTPGLTWAAQGPFSQPTIRGIGSTATAMGNSPNVALYVDGVYNSMQMGGLFKFHNVERIEVLKGPQGTLFGRNATGGAIQIITKNPGHETDLRVSGGFGDYGMLEGSAYATTGLTDRVAADLAVSYLKDDGYYKDIVTGDDLAKRRQVAARSKFLWTPTDTIDIVLALFHQEHRDTSPYATQAVPGARLAALAQDPDTPQPTRPFRVAHTFPPLIESRQTMANLNANFQIGEVNLQSITAFTKQSADAIADGDGSILQRLSFDFTHENESTQQEFILTPASADGKLFWTAGVFLLRDDNTLAKQRIFVGTTAIVGAQTEVDTEAWAVFGEVSYDLTDRLTGILGVRYSDEKRKSPGASVSWSDTSPRVSLVYALNDNVNVYATYSQGFKSGTFDAGELVDPEEIQAYEIGVKGDHGRFRYSAAAFYYDYTDIQVQAYIADSTAITRIQNAAEAEIWGFEAEIVASLTDSLRLRLGGSIMDAEYTDFPGATVFNPLPQGGNVQAREDVSGNKMIRNPDWTMNVGLDYSTMVQNGELRLTANAFFSGGYYWDVQNRLKEDSYEMVNARASWTTPSSQWRFSVWGENLTDSKMGLWVGSSTQGDRVAYARPIWFGATVDYFLK
jgi:iron complex outermembrane recepter protein